MCVCVCSGNLVADTPQSTRTNQKREKEGEISSSSSLMIIKDYNCDYFSSSPSEL